MRDNCRGDSGSAPTIVFPALFVPCGGRTSYETIHIQEQKMSNWEFGLTLTVFGMGGTMVILVLISLVVDLLNKCLPFREETKK
jgi:hypothetical protein